MDRHKFSMDLEDLFQKVFDNASGLFRTLDLELDFGPQTGIVESDSPLPSVSITTHKDGAQAELELAGYRKEDLSIEVEGQIIEISGERNQTGFTKTFRVDIEQFDIDSVEAGYEDGLLTITLDRVKAEPKIEKRFITIQ